MKKEVSGKKLTDKKIVVLFLIGLAVVLAVIATVVHFTTKVTDDSYKNCAVGDVDGSGYINAADAKLVLDYLAGEAELFDSQKKNGDVNLDGKLDNADVELIQAYATGSVNKLPVSGEEEPTEAHKENQIKHISEKAESTVHIENSWSNGDGTFSYQLKINVENLRDSRLRNWETKIVLSEDVEISKNWDCECEAQGDTVIIEGESIPAEETMSCGVIVIAPENTKIESLSTEN